MPRRSRSFGGGGGRTSMPRASRSTPSANVPAKRPSSSVAQPAPQTGQPGMLGQMASTAAGVAIGSTIGHVVGGALLGGNHGSDAPQEQQGLDQPTYQDQYSYPQQPQAQRNPCEYEMKAFIECAQNQGDISLCQGFNQVLKECKLSYGIS